MIYAPLDMQQTMGRESEQRVLSVSLQETIDTFYEKLNAEIYEQ